MLTLALLMAAALPGQSQGVAQPLKEATLAIEASRLDQARLLIARAVEAGAQGPAVDQLLADLDYAKGDYVRALLGYELLLRRPRAEPMLYERAGLSALQAGDVARAKRYLDRATASPAASWRAWNALGVAADRTGDWKAADLAYNRAAALAPDRAELANNRGWSHLLRGSWQEALRYFERAQALDPNSLRIADNLQLAQAAVSDDLPQRQAGESDLEFAARLNDAGVVARFQGRNRKAIAAFSQALAARTRWFERAANNLELAEAGR